MTKRILFIFCLCLAALTSLADEEKKVRLSEDHPQEMLQLGPCNVFISKGETDANGMAPLIVEVENSLEDQALLVFHVAYSEKGLKNGRPQITFWKNFPGSHDIENCDGLSRDIIITPSDKVTVPVNMRSGSDSPARLILPIYIAKDKKKGFNKLELREKLVYTFDIEAETGPSKEYLDLESRCNELVKEIMGKSFCNNPKHDVSLEDQEAPYVERAQALNEEIEQAIKSHDLKAGDAGYEKYNALKSKLKESQFTEKDCGKHKGGGGGGYNPPKPPKPPKPKSTCKYCSLSLSQIYQRMNDYYIKIRNQKVTKQQVIGDVNALYNCASQHSSEWKSNSSVRSKILENYKRIKNAK